MSKDARHALLLSDPEAVEYMGRVRWWQCGAVWISTLDSWTGYRFRAVLRLAGLPFCSRHRWHRGEHRK